MGGVKRPGASPGADEAGDAGLVELTTQGTSKRLRHTPPSSPCTQSQPACPICRGLLVQKCIQCSSTARPASPCMLSFGGCGCVYHEHCLSHWLHKRNVCPIHESMWQPTAPRMCPALLGA
mmetsp:Transcript_8837/g.17844  ORF Transcript_8837/g.17844 Transcript_8837/m.17844 type:complete len:121 (-) Transcript_8837:187-549(-)